MSPQAKDDLRFLAGVLAALAVLAAFLLSLHAFA